MMQYLLSVKFQIASCEEQKERNRAVNHKHCSEAASIQINLEIFPLQSAL